jgi:serine/threonine-protein kinase RsbW
MRLIAKCRNQKDSGLEIEMALSEALANAMVHGNQEDPHKVVHVACRCTTDGEVSITVQDEGQGFDRNAVPDPTTPENLLVKHGHGIYRMKTLMDEVRFEQRGHLFICARSPALGQPQRGKQDDTDKRGLKYYNRHIEIAAQ